MNLRTQSIVDNITDINTDNIRFIFERLQYENKQMPEFIMNLFEKLNYLYKKYNDEEIYFCEFKKMFTSEVDPSYIFKFLFELPRHKYEIYMPIVNRNNGILLHGNEYILVYQMIDKPIFWRRTDVTLQSNVNFYIKTNNLVVKTQKKKDFTVNFSSIKKEIPSFLFFATMLGIDEFMSSVGISFNKDFLSGKNIKDILNEDNRYDNKEIISDLFNIDNSKNFNQEHVNRLLESFFAIYDNLILKNKPATELLHDEFYIKNFIKITKKDTIEYINACLESFKLFDPFSYQFIESGNVLKDFIVFAMKDKLDFLDMKNKRIRLMELYLSKLLQYLYNMGLSILIKKKVDLRNVQRLRIDDVVTVNQLSMYLYRSNSMLKLSEAAKITQVGELGLNRESFVNRRSIHPSQIGYLCPISTHDRENCGVVLHLSVTSDNDFNQIYKWPKLETEKVLKLKPVSMKPIETEGEDSKQALTEMEEVEKTVFKE